MVDVACRLLIGYWAIYAGGSMGGKQETIGAQLHKLRPRAFWGCQPALDHPEC